MTPLATTFTFRGETFTQLKRVGKVALYKRHGGFEVIRIKDVPETKWPNGKITPEHEGYPSDNEFGTKGWYFMECDREGAEKRFKKECGK